MVPLQTKDGINKGDVCLAVVMHVLCDSMRLLLHLFKKKKKAFLIICHKSVSYITIEKHYDKQEKEMKLFIKIQHMFSEARKVTDLKYDTSDHVVEDVIDNQTPETFVFLTLRIDTL